PRVKASALDICLPSPLHAASRRGSPRTNVPWFGADVNGRRSQRTIGWARPARLNHCVLTPGALAFVSRDDFGAFLPLISLMGSGGSLYSIIAVLRSSSRKRLPCASNFSLNSLF